MKSKPAVIWICKTAKKQLALLILLSIISIITSVSYIGLALISRRAINIATAHIPFHEMKPQLITAGIELLLIVLGQLALTLLSSHLKTVVSGKFEIDLRNRLFSSIVTKKYSDIRSFHSGELINRFTSDIDIVVSGVTNFLPQALSIVAKILSGLIVIASFSTAFTAITLSVGAVVMICALLFSPVYKKLHKRVQRESGAMRSFAQECIENIVVVKSFSTKKPLLAKLGEYMKKLYKTKLLRNHISNAATGGVFLIFTLGYYATLLWGAFEIAAGKMDYGTLMAFLQIVSQIRMPFYNASGLISNFYGALASAERLMELEQLPNDKHSDDFNALNCYSALREIKVENITFSYGDGKVIIDESSFSLPKGCIASLTGASGAGKSTLFKLLLGLYEPTDGSITAVTDSGEFSIDASTRALFAYVPQGNLVLSGTVAENIKFGNPEISDELMIKAAETACLDEFISTLPDCYNTLLGERGLGLSEGQVQRIAIARALLSDAPILLLDECTSALDEATERKLLDNLAALSTKTVLFISHRNTSLSICDTHIRLENHRLTVE